MTKKAGPELKKTEALEYSENRGVIKDDSLPELARFAQAIRMDDGLVSEDQEDYDRLSAQVALLYFARPNTLFNARGAFYVVFEGRRRGIYADWNMANDTTMDEADGAALLSMPSSRDSASHHVSSSSNTRTVPVACPPTLHAAPSPSRLSHPTCTQPSASSMPTRIANSMRTHPSAQPTPSRMDRSTRTSVMPIALPLRPNSRDTPVQTAAFSPSRGAPQSTSGSEGLVHREPQWFIVTSSSELAVFSDRVSADRRALEHDDLHQLQQYCRTASMASMLDIVEEWAGDHGGS
ncbi:hypothetical protein C8R45DRAFT_932898 [Mycena sanguinolenta]|nr:hypothetical protein C8R45DRAFT_932898 [Mycena sanguinolenta]